MYCAVLDSDLSCTLCRGSCIFSLLLNVQACQRDSRQAPERQLQVCSSSSSALPLKPLLSSTVYSLKHLSHVFLSQPELSSSIFHFKITCPQVLYFMFFSSSLRHLCLLVLSSSVSIACTVFFPSSSCVLFQIVKL